MERSIVSPFEKSDLYIRRLKSVPFFERTDRSQFVSKKGTDFRRLKSVRFSGIESLD